MRQQRRIYEIDFEYHKMRMQHNFKLMTNNNLPFDMGSGGQGPMPSFGQVPALGYGCCRLWLVGYCCCWLWLL